KIIPRLIIALMLSSLIALPAQAKREAQKSWNDMTQEEKVTTVKKRDQQIKERLEEMAPEQRAAYEEANEEWLSLGSVEEKIAYITRKVANMEQRQESSAERKDIKKHKESMRQNKANIKRNEAAKGGKSKQ